MVIDPKSRDERDESSSLDSEIVRLLRHSDYLLALSQSVQRRVDEASRRLAMLVDSSREFCVRRNPTDPSNARPKLARRRFED